MGRKRIWFGLMCCIVVLQTTSVWSADDKSDFQRALRYARNGQIDFAFMKFRAVLQDTSDMESRQAALFASGEYYYLNLDYHNAIEAFQAYLRISKDINGRLFAMVYLWRIYQRIQDQKQSQEMEGEILRLRRNSYIFETTKDYQFKSPMNRSHRAVYSIDRIEFFIEGDAIAKIVY